MNINTILASVASNNMVLNRKSLQHSTGIAYFIGKMTQIEKTKMGHPSKAVELFSFGH